MKGKTRIIDITGNTICAYDTPMDFQVGEIVELEEAPHGKPLLTEYRLVRKHVKVSIAGFVTIDYHVSQVNDSVEQKFFLA